MLARFLLVITLLSITSTCIQGQDIEFEHLDISEGLPHSIVRSVLQDQQGYLWIGTDQGLTRYNGHQFITYNDDVNDSTDIADYRISALYQDKKGILWIGGVDRGLMSFDPSEEKFEWHTPYLHIFSSAWEKPGRISSAGIHQILEDRVGNFWIATWDGLNIFDKEAGTFEVFQHIPNDPSSLSGNTIQKIFQDSRGTFWVGTRPDENSGVSGLHRYLPEENAFKRYDLTMAPSDFNRDYPNTVFDIYEDSSGNLLVGACGYDLHTYDPVKDSFSSIESNIQETFELNIRIKEKKRRGSCSGISSILEDPAEPGRYWLSSNYFGLFYHDLSTQETLHFPGEAKSNHDVSHDWVHELYLDNQNTVWAPTIGGGINRIISSKTAFTITDFAPLQDQNSAGVIVTRNEAMVHDADNNLWVGAYTQGTERKVGLKKIHAKTGQVTEYKSDPTSPNSLVYNEILTLNMDVNDSTVLWIGTRGHGISKMDIEEETFYTFTFGVDTTTSNLEERLPSENWINQPVDSVEIASVKTLVNTILTLYQQPSNPETLWVGTPAGLHRLDKSSGVFSSYLIVPPGEAGRANIITSVHEDRNGRLFVGTGFGIWELKPQTGYATSVVPKTAVLFIHQDQEKNYWAGTPESGLLKFDSDWNLVQEYSTNNGLAGTQVSSLIEDEAGNFWLGLSAGIAKFSPESGLFNNFPVDVERRGWFFAKDAVSRSADGRLFFGTADEVVSFDPTDFAENAFPPSIVIEDIHIQGLSIRDRPDLLENTAPSMVESVSLPHDQNDVTFEYVGLHFKEAKKNRYSFILENYDASWRDAADQRSVQYTNLPKGTYTFKVKAANSDGIWSDESASVSITILPPWWRTTFAFVVYGLLFVVGVIGIDRFQRRRLIAKERLRAEREKAQAIASTNTELERALKHLTETQDQLIHTEKMASLGQLTAGVAHEIKNPLNFINNFAMICAGQAEEIEEVLEQEKSHLSTESAHELKEILDDLKVNASKINEHGHRADGIIRSMLEHSRSEAGEKRPVDINKLLDEYVNLSYHAVRARTDGEEVSITRDYAGDLPKVSLVPQEIGRVFINLLDNAFYAIKEKTEDRSPKSEGSLTEENPSDLGLLSSHFSPEVNVSTSKTGKGVEIRIADNGTGIPGEIQSKIFEPFFTTKPTGSGTGLGLSLSYDIVTQGHGGSLSVESEEGEGAVFVITLP